MNRKGKTWLPAVLASLLAGGALTATAAENSAGEGIEEIVVTATYRDTKLMNTPLSISAVNEDTITQLNATDIGGLFRSIPGLNVVSSSNGNNRMVVRGISSQTGLSAYGVQGDTTATYIDDTPMTSAAGPVRAISGSLFDMERVEVLKGPQGTLFGEGSQGGTIRYLYNAPDREAIDYKIKLGFHNQDVSDDDSYRVDAMLNLPVSDTFAVRLSGFTSDEAGWIDKTNVTPIQKDINSNKAEGGRLAAKWWASDKLTIRASIFDVSLNTEGAVVSQSIPYVESDNGSFVGIDPYSIDEITLYNLRFDYDLEWATFTSTTSYYEREVDLFSTFAAATSLFFDNFLGTFLNPPTGEATGPIPCNPGPQDALLSNPNICPYGDGKSLVGFGSFLTVKSDRTTQEFRLVSNSYGTWLWTTGLFYKSSEDDINGRQQVGYAAGREHLAPLIDPLFQGPSNIHTDELREISVFGEATYLMGEDWEFTLGARFTDLEQDYSATPEGKDDTVVSPKLNIAWHPADNQLYYFTYATGFRPGNLNGAQAFNRDIFTANGFSQEAIDRAASHLDYDGDELSNFEFGGKITLADGRVQLVAALYRMEWDDMIQLTFDPLIPGVIQDFNDNVGEAHSQGLEYEITWMPRDRLTLRLAGDFNEAETDSDNEGSPSASPLPKGSPLIYSPEWSFAASVDYGFDLGSTLEGRLRLDYHKQDKQFFTGGLLELNEFDGYAQTSMRFTLSSREDTRWTAALFANNLTGEDNVIFGSTGGITGNDLIRLRPRQVGLEFTWGAR